MELQGIWDIYLQVIVLIVKSITEYRQIAIQVAFSKMRKLAFLRRIFGTSFFSVSKCCLDTNKNFKVHKHNHKHIYLHSKPQNDTAVVNGTHTLPCQEDPNITMHVLCVLLHSVQCTLIVVHQLSVWVSSAITVLLL